MTRRNIIKLAALFGFAIPMAQFDALKAQGDPAGLTIPLDHWRGLTFKYKGKSVHITSADIFKALEGISGER